VNLQPINPPMPAGSRVQCSACGKMYLWKTMKADLDAKAGTFLCSRCRPLPSWCPDYRRKDDNA
jgi:hypothetical protein